MTDHLNSKQLELLRTRYQNDDSVIGMLLRHIADLESITQRIHTAANRVLDAVEFDDANARLNIMMPGHEYGFEMDEKILNPLAEAIVLLGSTMDSIAMSEGQATE